MKRNQLALSLLVVALSPAMLRAQSVNTLTTQEKAQGWQLLFDGKTLAGWHVSAPPPAAGRAGGQQPPTPGQVGSPKPCLRGAATSDSAAPAGASHWEVVEGQLTACGTPAGYLTSDRSYKNFVLSVEFKCADDTNSGVFVRSPQESGGYEVQIWRQQPAGYNTGSIVGLAKTAREYTFKADQWNRFEITADGDHLLVVLNGETTLDVRDGRFPEGHLRLQYQQFPIAFRNIRIRQLPDPSRAQDLHQRETAMTQTKIDETIAAYAAAWSESNDASRRQLLEKAWATNGTYTDPTAHVEGREGLVQHIAGFLESMPGARIVTTSHTDSHHGALRFSWRLTRSDGTTVDGMDFGELDGDGRIKKIVGFFGPFSPLDR